MKNRKQFFITLSFALMFAIGLLLRLVFLPGKTLDMKAYVLWYDYIVQHGIINSLGDQSFGYNPPFIYLLSLVTLTRSFLPTVWAIKLIPLAFDVINFVLVYQIIRMRFPDGSKPLLAAFLFWIAPTVLINSSLWGQTDSLYVCFLLLTLLYLLKDRPVSAVVAFALSIAVKAQGIFLAPLLGVLFFKKQIRWHTFLLVPLVYAATFLPALLTGRPLASLFSTYTAQGETFTKASMNAPNFYFFLPQSAYQASLMVGIPLAGLILLAWVLIYGLKRYRITPALLVLTALVSLALTPFLLPKMHDRYFYPADIFSLVAAFFIPEIWFVPVAYQVISLVSYTPYLLELYPPSVMPYAVQVNTLTLGFLLWKQWRMALNKSREEQ
jgi:Gpi18-like mannosyltransferase